ncbi:MAG: methyl-accepting chemotaxis protein [Aquabacterium sp.]|nr:methyl-accepting chemotaxis protein [Aquabacterium sp.]
MNITTRGRAVLNALGVRQQLFGAFFLLLLLTGLLGGTALLGLQRVNAEAHDLATKWLIGLGSLAEVRSGLITSREFEIKLSKTADKSYQSEYRDKMAEASKSVAAALDVYTKTLASAEERAAMDKARQDWDKYRASQERVVQLGQSKPQDAADLADGASSMLFDELVVEIDALIKATYKGGQDADSQASGTYEQARMITAVLLSLAVVVGVLLALGISRRLFGQLGGEPALATRVARAVADGDLSTPIPVRAGDTSSLLANLQAMQQALTATVAHVRQGSERVSLASSEIAQGNQDLSGRTEQQASALQQTAATMEQLGATVHTNAGNARLASELATGASSVAQRGGVVVGEVVETMRGINESSRRIADIIGTIDGIAFQTNILALNAAVEAARAGEQGRGFAVVAGEVRSLAQRSADAAREIKGLITASVERVEHGSALVGRAGTTMGEIVSAIQRVSEIVNAISTASSEQSNGVTQVGLAVTDLDRSTQQNAALVEQSAAAAESLRTQARLLVDAVAVFKLTGGAGHVPAAVPVYAPAARPPVAKPQAGRGATPRVAATTTAAATATATATAAAARLPAPAVARRAPAAPSRTTSPAPAPAPATAAATHNDAEWETF